MHDPRFTMIQIDLKMVQSLWTTSMTPKITSNDPQMPGSTWCRWTRTWCPAFGAALSRARGWTTAWLPLTRWLNISHTLLSTVHYVLSSDFNLLGVAGVDEQTPAALWERCQLPLHWLYQVPTQSWAKRSIVQNSLLFLKFTTLSQFREFCMMLTSLIIHYRNSLLQSIGCSSPWNPLSNNSLPICSSPNSIFAYEDHYFDLSYQYKREIVRLTGCSLPCRYRQYSLAKSGAPAPSQMSSGDVLLLDCFSDSPFLAFLIQFLSHFTPYLPSFFRWIPNTDAKLYQATHTVFC